MFDVVFDGRRYLDPKTARAAGVPGELVGAAFKIAASARIAAMAERLRGNLAPTSPGKLAAYKVKEEIARDPDAADPAELAMLEREATARGMTLDDLLTAIAAQATAYRRVALLVEAIEAEAEAALRALDAADPEIDARIAEVLAQAQSEADAEYEAAASLLSAA